MVEPTKLRCTIGVTYTKLRVPLNFGEVSQWGWGMEVVGSAELPTL